MTLVREIFGFFVGLLFGGFALMALVMFVPQFNGSDTPKEVVASDGETLETVAPAQEEQPASKLQDTSVEAEVEDQQAEVAKADPEPADMPTPEVGDEQPIQVIEEQPAQEAEEQPAQDVAEQPVVDVEEQPAQDVAEQPAVEAEEQPAAPRTGLQSEDPKTAAKPKKLKLPTIEPEAPIEAVEEPVGEAEEQPAQEVAEQPTVEIEEQPTVEVEEEPAAPRIVLQSEKPKSATKPKKFKLPTIEPEAPVEAAEDPAEDTGITVGKKPASTLPSITREDPEINAEEIPNEAVANNALELNATKFDPTDRPLLGVILLDIDDKGLSVKQLKSLKAPLTIAIRVDDPNASARALEYSAAGFEVIVMASDDRNARLNLALNSGQIQDAMDVMFTTVPNAIGLLDSMEAKIQKNGRISKAIVAGFVDTGHGLITYAKGLNSIDREARAAGVRTAKVARALDANRENKALITRYLDRASLDAGRDGAAIVLGTTAKDTVAAIAIWVLGSKGKSIELAPASAVLLGM